MDRRVTPPTWDPIPPCKQALTRTLLEQAISIKANLMTKQWKYQRVGIDIRLNKGVRYGYPKFCISHQQWESSLSAAGRSHQNKDLIETENRVSLVPRVLSAIGLRNAAKFRTKCNEECTPCDNNCVQAYDFFVIIGKSKFAHFYEVLIDLLPSSIC